MRENEREREKEKQRKKENPVGFFLTKAQNPQSY